MKRKLMIFIWAMLVVAFGKGGQTFNTYTPHAATNEYVIDSFSSLPNDWSLYKRSDTNYVQTNIVNNELIINHSNTEGTQADKYYGAVYQFNGASFGDFTFKMEFSIESYLNESRFIGVLWHANEIDDYLNSLYMNYRINGKSAPSTIYSTGKFKDEQDKTMPIILSDKEYHTLKIIMNGNLVSHYIDDNLIVKYDTSNRYTNDLLTEQFPLNGKFGLLVNKCSIKIKSIKISDVPEIMEESNLNDEELVTTYQDNNDLTNFPTVVADITNTQELATLKSSQKKPSNAILHMDKNQDIVDLANVKMDSFENIYTNILQKQIIPIVRVEDMESANALINFLRYKHDILDMAVLSSNPELVKIVKEARSRIRGIISFENSHLEIPEIVETLNKNYATVALFSEDMAKISDIYYVQARFKTVWVNVKENANFLEISNIINSSCYGLVANDFNKIYEAYLQYDKSAYPHPVFNVAHRGLPDSYNENSISGIIAAMNSGATHLELDCYLTTDNRVVIMHDAEIGRTTNGEGNIENYSLEELRQYKLDLFEPYEDIPLLEDVIKAMQDYKDVVLVLEVKSSKVGVDGIVKYIKEIIQNYDFLTRVIFISFNLDIIGRLKTMIPECPTAYLGAINATTFASGLTIMGQYNTIYDTSQNNVNKNFNQQFLRDRGYIGWFWTFEGAAQIELTVPTNGYVGITNDIADRYANKIKFIRGISFTLGANQNLEDFNTLKLEIETYNGNLNVVEGLIFSYVEKENYYDVICSYLVNEYVDKTYYTQSFPIYKFNQGDNDSSPSVNPSVNNSTSQGNVSTPIEDSPSFPQTSTPLSPSLDNNGDSNNNHGFEFDTLNIILLVVNCILIAINGLFVTLNIKNKKLKKERK